MEDNKVVTPEVAYENLSLEQKIYKREDFRENQMAYNVVNMIRAGWEKDKIINEILDRYNDLYNRYHRIIEVSLPTNEKQRVYIETGKHE